MNWKLGIQNFFIFSDDTPRDTKKPAEEIRNNMRVY